MVVKAIHSQYFIFRIKYARSYFRKRKCNRDLLSESWNLDNEFIFKYKAPMDNNLTFSSSNTFGGISEKRRCLEPNLSTKWIHPSGLASQSSRSKSMSRVVCQPRRRLWRASRQVSPFTLRAAKITGNLASSPLPTRFLSE